MNLLQQFKQLKNKEELIKLLKETSKPKLEFSPDTEYNIVMRGFSLMWVVITTAILAAVGGAYYVGRSSSSVEPVASRENSAQEQLIPTPTMTPTPTPAPTSKSTKPNFTKPANWITVRDQGSIFELSYDPSLYSGSSDSAGTIILAVKPYGNPIVLQVKPYNGGSRHQFIYKQLGIKDYNEISTPNSYEVDNNFSGRSGLVLYNISYSASATLGMVNIDDKRALLITASETQDRLEKILATLKIL